MSGLYFFVVLGGILKLGPIAVIDELALIVYVTHKTIINKKFSRGFKYLHFVILILILFSLAGFINILSMNSLRYFIVFIFIYLYLMLPVRGFGVNKSYVYYGSVFIILVDLLIPLYFVINDYEAAYWQNGILTGTAYAAIPVFLAGYIGLKSAKNPMQMYSIIVISILASMVSDTRLGLFLSLLLCCYVFLIINYKRKLLIILLLMPIILTLFFSGYLEIPLNKVLSAYNGLAQAKNPEFSASYNRLEQIRISFNAVINENLILLGNGTLTHQYGLAEYLGADRNGSRVRPIGISAFIYDYGLFFTSIIIILLICSSVVVTKGLYYIDKWFLRLVGVILIATIFITNVADMIIFWLFFSSNFIKFIRELEK